MLNMKKRTPRVLDHFFIKSKTGLGLEILKMKTSKPISPAKPGFRFEIYKENKPK